MSGHSSRGGEGCSGTHACCLHWQTIWTTSRRWQEPEPWALVGTMTVFQGKGQGQCPGDELGGSHSP